MAKKICEIEECTAYRASSGLCYKHLMRLRRHGDPLLTRYVKSNMYKTSEYKTWLNIKDRCYNKNSKSYRWYGQLGVTVCDRWINNFNDFFEDMGKKPSPSHSIDRINPFGDYTPENCRWATPEEQVANKRANHNS